MTGVNVPQCKELSKEKGQATTTMSDTQADRQTDRSEICIDYVE